MSVVLALIARQCAPRRHRASRIMKKIFSFPLSVFVFLAPLFAFAQTVISPAIPGMTGSVTAGTSPGAFIQGFYQFALMIGGVLAFGAIVYGGVLYAASAGNPSKQSEGKEWMKSALLGILLLAGAYLILYTINPNLVNLSLPTLSAVNVMAPSNSPIGPNPAVCTPPCASGYICKNSACVNMSTITPININQPIIINPNPVINIP